ncbi:MAG: Asp23/Gls24 family envelope stress response protein [Anaerolineaceae bacterium]|nr:Asp23/Gls24 family envelope stress response protein [Anaerolineaceae bacterium]
MTNNTDNPLGNVFISHRAIATIAAQTALSSYGVVGFTSRDFLRGIVNLVIRDQSYGVEISVENDVVGIDIYIVVEYGVRITEVASSVASSIRFNVEKITGLSVDRVDVHIRGLRISDMD